MSLKKRRSAPILSQCLFTPGYILFCEIQFIDDKEDSFALLISECLYDAENFCPDLSISNSDTVKYQHKLELKDKGIAVEANRKTTKVYRQIAFSCRNIIRIFESPL